MRDLLGMLVVECALELLNEESYAATVAGLGYHVLHTSKGFEVHVEGYSHKLHRLLLRVCEIFASLALQAVDSAVLERVRQSVHVRLLNEGFEARTRMIHVTVRACARSQPHFQVDKLCTMSRLQCLESVYFSPSSKLALLSLVLPEDVRGHLAEELSRGLRVDAYAGGNLNDADAKNMYSDCLAAFTCMSTVLPVNRLQLSQLGSDACMQLTPSWTLLVRARAHARTHTHTHN
jgi:secreted Zn-dependent insulinase-like peptidase